MAGGPVVHTGAKKSVGSSKKGFGKKGFAKKGVVGMKRVNTREEAGVVRAVGAVGRPRGGESGEAGTKSGKTQSTSGSWHTYVYRVFRQMNEEDGEANNFSMKRHTAQIFHSVVTDLIDRIGYEAGELSKNTKSRTLRVNDIAAAIKLVTRNTEVTGLMLRDGAAALEKYKASLPS